MHGQQNIKLYSFLASMLDGSEKSASFTGYFTLGERAPVTAKQVAFWDPQNCLHISEDKILCRYRTQGFYVNHSP